MYKRMKITSKKIARTAILQVMKLVPALCWTREMVDRGRTNMECVVAAKIGLCLRTR
jgi:hypothetical protein